MIDTFDGENSFLSNFHMCDILYEGIAYPSTEHAFQAAKTHNLGMRQFIANLKTAGQSKKQGKLVELRADWESVKDSVMLDILRIKFSEPSMGRRLLKTGAEYLTEGNVWHDNYWGICDCNECTRHAPGRNMLGKLLMKVRDELSSLQK